ncbi:MAG: hypothetical protein WCE75_13075 [Terracidiphilus sp.]
MPLPRRIAAWLKRPSLVRGVPLSLAVLAGTMLLAGFPAPDAPHPSNWHALLVPLALWGMIETGGCMGRRLNFYFAGVMVLLYSELMILFLVLFFWLWV